MDNLSWNPNDYNDTKSLSQIYRTLSGDGQADIPFIVWLLENPKSPISLPGNINLFNHDCMHILLGMGVTNIEEAFVVGFCMGNATDTTHRHKMFFKIIASTLFPNIWRFKTKDILSYDAGFNYGKHLKLRNIHLTDFRKYMKVCL